MRSRRVLLLVALIVAPLAAACVASPTAPADGDSPATTDTTGRKKEQLPWN